MATLVASPSTLLALDTDVFTDWNKHWRDVYIAATALAQGYGVATRNQGDFELIGQHLPPRYSTLQLAIWKP